MGSTHTAYYQEYGIVHKTMAPHTLQQSGDAEHPNRSWTDKVWAIILLSKPPKSLWPDIFKWANYVWNQSPTACLINMMPYKAFLGVKPNLTICHELGKIAMVCIPKQEHGKLDVCAIPCCLLRVDSTSKAWWVWDRPTHKLYLSCDCIFPADYTTAPTEEHCEDLQGEGSGNWLPPCQDQFRRYLWV